MWALEHYVHQSGLDPKLLELVKLRASFINGCAYCLDRHTKVARSLGETEQRLYEVSLWREAPLSRSMAGTDWRLPFPPYQGPFRSVGRLPAIERRTRRAPDNQRRRADDHAQTCLRSGLADGTRFLVERLWPPGLVKAKVHVDAWLKDVGPSTEVRKWFDHDPDKWDECRKRYWRELESRPDTWQPIVSAARRGLVTLVYSSHDTEPNNAVALREYLEAKIHRSPRAATADRPRRRSTR